jgi:hypothetical protein
MDLWNQQLCFFSWCTNQVIALPGDVPIWPQGFPQLFILKCAADVHMPYIPFRQLCTTNYVIHIQQYIVRHWLHQLYNEYENLIQYIPPFPTIPLISKNGLYTSSVKRMCYEAIKLSNKKSPSMVVSMAYCTNICRNELHWSRMMEWSACSSYK